MLPRVARICFEALEARCLLSITPLADALFSADVIGGGGTLLAGGTRPAERDWPRFEIVPDLEDGGLIPIPGDPPYYQEPPQDLPDDDLPEPNWPEPNLPNEPGDEGDSGGLVELENEPADLTPLHEPSPREVRSVLQMLAALKYPVAGVTATVRSEEADSPFEFARQERERNRAVDGGAVAVAVRELADELEAEPPQTQAAVQSLLEIAVPMDRSTGRYQAFEVLTSEEVSFAPSDELPADGFLPRISAAEPEGAAAESSQPQGDLPVVPQRGAGGESSTTTGAPATTADEERSSVWSLAIGLVTFGFILQLLPRKRTELQKEQLQQGVPAVRRRGS